MITRYTRPEMGRIFSEQNRFDQWLAVELAAARGLGRNRRSPGGSRARAARPCRIRCRAHHEIEREIKHDVIAFTTAVAEKMAAAGAADASRWLHYGLTSNDVVDTAQALMLKQASEILLEGARERWPRSSNAGPTNSRTPCRSAAPTASTPSPSLSA